MIKYFALTLVLIISVQTGGFAQNTDQAADAAYEEPTEYAYATFKSARIINGHSIERLPEGQLDFRIAHRFGTLNSGAYNLWGLDQANMHFSLEYGFKNWLMAGIGRGTYEKAFDGFLKFGLLRQKRGGRTMPVSITYLAGAAVNTLKFDNEPYFWDRVSYVHQLLIARKFNDFFSLELNPSFLHENMVATELDPNDVFSLGAGIRLKITEVFSLNAEYYYVFPPRNDFRSVKTFNPLAIGFDIDTGGHIFTIMLTNSVAMIENGFITNTQDSWKNGGIHLGFNISRYFILK